MTRFKLIGRFIHYRKVPLGVVGLIASILSLTYLVVNGLSASVAFAVEQNIVTQNGQYSYVIQLFNGNELAEKLSSQPDLTRVADISGEVRTAIAAAPADIRLVDDRSTRFGILTSGSYPTAVGEVTLSADLMDALKVQVGDQVMISAVASAPVRVVGVTTYPATERPMAVVGVVDRIDSQQVTAILTNTDPSANPTLLSVLERREAAARNVSRLAENEANAARKSVLAGLGQAQWALFVISTALLTCAMALMVRIFGRDAVGLQASGMAANNAWLLIVSAQTFIVLLGTVIGSSLGYVVLQTGKSQISHIVGQNWQVVSLHELSVAGFIAGLVIVPGLCLSGLLLLRSHVPRAWGKRLTFTPRLATMLTLGWLILLVLTLLQIASVTVGALASGMAVIAVPPLLLALFTRNRAGSTMSVARTLITALLPVTVIVSGLVWFTAWNSGVMAHTAISMRESSAAIQPPGSLLVYKTPAESVDQLVNKYQSLGGVAYRSYSLPDESQHLIRVVSELRAECMRRKNTLNFDIRDQRCTPENSRSPVSIVVLDESPGAAEIVADPTLIEGGKVGILRFRPNVRRPEAEELQSYETEADPLLGGNMPGAVLAARGDLARSLSLVAGKSQMIAFLDFAELPPEAQATFRSFITRLAPTSQMAEERHQHEDIDMQHTLATAWALVGSILAGLLTIVAGFALVSSFQRLRRILADIAPDPSKRRRLTYLVFSIPSLSMVLATLLGRLSAWLSGVHDGTGFGWIWLAPGVAACFSLVVVASAFDRVPGNDRF